MSRSAPVLKRRRTKIVATVGPSSSSRAMLQSLVDAGVNVFRLNMSHGDHEGHRAVYDAVRQMTRESGETIGILADLSGPKIRVGRFAGGSIELESGAPAIVTTRDVEGEPGLIPSQYEMLHQDVEQGSRILLDDGNLELRVERVHGHEIECTVVHGGTLKDRKGMNLPGVRVSAPSLTEKDRRDAEFALALGVDFLALSFVRKAADVEELRSLMQERGKSAWIIAKIEKPEALDEIESILEVSDGIMVARGDLGVELPPELVPTAQARLVDLARSAGKPVIVATQMLESMISSPRPTRAEVSDVANAVRSGTDAVMLSAETASGRFPVQAVAMMDRVARETESQLFGSVLFGGWTTPERRVEEVMKLGHAISRATAQLSRDLKVRAVVVFSSSGTTAQEVSSARPAAPVIAASPVLETARRMTLLWGTVPLLIDPSRLDDPVQTARELVREFGLAQPGERIVRVAGFSADAQRNAPTITVFEV
ncbi:MAG TPA: pyruvate kinase [Thermoanaerobaculia bacterium]